MKIALVLPNVPAYSETFFKNKILGLQQSGHEVLLYVNHSKAPNSYLNCKVVKAPVLNRNQLFVAFNLFLEFVKVLFLNPAKSFKLYQLNKKDEISFSQNLKQILANQFLLSEKVDWLHFGFGTMALGRENVATAIGAEMAVSFRGFDYYVYPVRNKNCYSVLFAKKVKYHVLSEGMKKGLMANGIKGEVIFKITPAIDIEIFDARESIKSDTIQIKTVARLHWIKGLEATLEAVSLLKKEGIDFHYTIIGDGVEKERLQFAIHQLGLNDNVTLAGKLSSEQVKEALSKADIYLQYSIQEGFCNAVLEAQAMGLLCVVSNAEGLSENVLDNQTGFVVAKQNPLLLFEKIKELLQLPENKKQIIGDQAVLRVQKEFNLEKQQKEFLAFYTE
ncbi:colanic acid/amylovoran biosynthesis glycosyltransferase [Flavobacterium arsenatis]|uniref:Colanic acid/amylovoran biosynthesis glycosyltransferase n=1 Tax=Flavobacterium arsenatis TaxID=1484332 RepID=A0ABU1TNJ5_9FLAO|nr:glycosyltransferase family 4 protein [Flavobacterium arsenatis]MDR6966997.1 colanic acid/amylovoran biosynthesis glycosyltransferase [Flavobacterium arsenatis]